MKVWRFYIRLKEDVRNENSKDQDKYALYAVTNHKELAKRFSDERNMKIFQIKSSKMEPSEYAEFANDNRDCVLKEEGLITRATNPNGTIGTATVKILLTTYEYQCSCSDEAAIDIFSEAWWVNAGKYNNFSKPLRNALKYMYYDQFQKILSDYTNVIDDDYSAPDTFVDELLSFIKTFKGTF